MSNNNWQPSFVVSTLVFIIWLGPGLGASVTGPKSTSGIFLMVLSEKGDTSYRFFNQNQHEPKKKKHVLTKHEDPKRYLTAENFEQEKNRNT